MQTHESWRLPGDRRRISWHKNSAWLLNKVQENQYHSFIFDIISDNVLKIFTLMNVRPPCLRKVYYGMDIPTLSLFFWDQYSLFLQYKILENLVTLMKMRFFSHLKPNITSTDCSQISEWLVTYFSPDQKKFGIQIW